MKYRYTSAESCLRRGAFVVVATDAVIVGGCVASTNRRFADVAAAGNDFRLDAFLAVNAVTANAGDRIAEVDGRITFAAFTKKLGTLNQWQEYVLIREMTTE